MADRVTIVSPRDPWPFSTVTADDLEALVADGLLRPLSGDSQPEWMAPPSGAALSPPTLRWPRRRYLMPRRRGAQNRDPSWGAAASSPRSAVPTGGVSRSGSGPMGLRIPSSFLMMSERSSLGTGFVSVPRQRWGRFGRPWRSFVGTFPRSSR
jgi:hypothetical protein